MAHFFVPPNEIGTYGQTNDGGFTHAWKITVNAGSMGKIGLWGGYDRGSALQLSSNNPGIIDYSEPAITPAQGDRFISISGKRPGFTILDARNAPVPAPPWCSLQVEVLPELYTPNIPEWRLEQMAWDYYKEIIGGEGTDADYCRRWKLRQDQYQNLKGIINRAGLGRSYWEKQENIAAPGGRLILPIKDFLVIGEGGIVTMDSDYGSVVLGRRLSELRPRTGIGSIAGAVARIFTSDPNIIGVIESSGDLVEVGLAGFAVVRENQSATKPVIYPTRTIGQRKIVGDMFRDHVAAEVRKMHEGTQYTVDTEVSFQTDLGERNADVVLRDPSGKIVCTFECKTGLGNAIKAQMKKDTRLYLDKDIRTIKVTNDFFFVPE